MSISPSISDSAASRMMAKMVVRSVTPLARQMAETSSAPTGVISMKRRPMI
ncbi:hypothetical protein [uncultured Porphyromonas sp.]|uniref:hypothetical protein n=1 Tax=uncultured Porphyromonas sp. TaxID=159274 RepID=UPI0026166405|nr:hypothetical protein [uncultured Porphyromonas sp.]